MNEATIIARQERQERERKSRSDAINRLLFSEVQTVESMRAELFMSRAINVVSVLILVSVSIAHSLGV